MALCPGERAELVEVTDADDESEDPRVYFSARGMTDLGNGLATVDVPVNSLPDEIDVWIETNDAGAGTQFTMANVPGDLGPDAYWTGTDSSVASGQDLIASVDCG
jgi:hypothetical protein